MLIITKPIIGLLLMAAAAFGEPGQGQGLAPFHAAQAAFDEAIRSFANVGPDHCYTNTSAAKLDIGELKLKFESYRMALLNVNKTRLPVGAKKDLKEVFKANQKAFAATKRDLRTKKRAAKLGGKRCFWTRNPTPPPTQPPTEPQTPPPTEEPTPVPTQPPTLLGGDFFIRGYFEDDCQAKMEELKNKKYTHINSLYIDGGQQSRCNCVNLDLNWLKGMTGLLAVKHCPYLLTINADQLQTIGSDSPGDDGRAIILNNPLLTAVNLNKVQTIGGPLTVRDNPRMNTLGLADLNQIGMEGFTKEDYYGNIVDVRAKVMIYGNQVNFCSGGAFQSVCSTDKACDISKCE